MLTLGLAGILTWLGPFLPWSTFWFPVVVHLPGDIFMLDIPFYLLSSNHCYPSSLYCFFRFSPSLPLLSWFCFPAPTSARCTALLPVFLSWSALSLTGSLPRSGASLQLRPLGSSLRQSATVSGAAPTSAHRLHPICQPPGARLPPPVPHCRTAGAQCIAPAPSIGGPPPGEIKPPAPAPPVLLTEISALGKDAHPGLRPLLRFPTRVRLPGNPSWGRGGHAAPNWAAPPGWG